MVANRIAKELRLNEKGVAAVVRLLSEGATVPFVARYRKEATGGLDEVQIRAVAERRAYLVQLDERRATILASIESQGSLTPELRRLIAAAASKTELEDLYAPFKPKRRTKATMALERGLGPLADTMWRQPRGDEPIAVARQYVDRSKDVPDAQAALAGARDICAERMADAPESRRHVREILERHGSFRASKIGAAKKQRTKFDDHAGRVEAFGRMATHRYLALCRGEAEKVLRVSLALDDDSRLRQWLARRAVRGHSPWAHHLEEAAGDALKRLLLPRATADLRSDLADRAYRDAVMVFAKNLQDLLLAAPFGERPVVAIDPGQRTGCKCVALDATGSLIAHDTIFLVQGDRQKKEAAVTLRRLVERVGAEAVAIGNGTHGRETLAFARETLGDEVVTVSVNEAGASVYSASEVAREELGQVDVVVRGAVSIGRRLQDPLAELVKIDPASIGVGQYQHDVPAKLLSTKLGEVVEDAVNGVGVALNTASPALLARVAGLGPKQSRAIVAHRDKHGRFRRRQQLLKVSGIGPKAFEQAAGFLRIPDGDHPLDASAVHPERYALVERMARDLRVSLDELLARPELVARIDRHRYEQEAGAYTLADILAELAKPGRDPRDSFQPPAFRDDVRTMADLNEGMVLEGVVTNVTNFGAFVDVGVKQDGLVHISQLADRFVKHPSDVVSVGSTLTVRVLEVDHERKRISLTAKGLARA